MPYHIENFEEKINQMMYLKVKPFGWIYEDDGIELEFGWCFLNNYDPEECLCMHIKDTNHYWAWFRTNFIQLSKGDYVQLFTKQLEEFRIEFLLWIKNPDTMGLDWVREYYEIFQGMFYDFSPEEQEEYFQAQDTWQQDQSEIDRFADEIDRYRAFQKKQEIVEKVQNTKHQSWYD